MRLDRNIILSLVIHVSLLLAVMTSAVGKNAASDLRGKYVTVTLFEPGKKGALTKTAEPFSDNKKAKAGSPPPLARFEKPGVPVVLPVPKAAATAVALDETGSADLPMKPAREISGSGSVKAALHGESDGSSAGPMSVSLFDRAEKKGVSGQEKGQPGAGDAALTGVIRGAIQRALIYPATARRRGIEGTVVAEFRINGEGLPEGLRISKSSGHRLLDKAARETILRAAPLPQVKGKIEIPITFRLTHVD
jgi:TonB family protein